MEFWWPWAASFSPSLFSQGRVKTRVVLPEADPSPEYVPSAYPGACRKEPWGDPRLSSHTFYTVLELESHLHGCSHLPGHRSHTTHGQPGIPQSWPSMKVPPHLQGAPMKGSLAHPTSRSSLPPQTSLSSHLSSASQLLLESPLEAAAGLRVLPSQTVFPSAFPTGSQPSSLAA